MINTFCHAFSRKFRKMRLLAEKARFPCFSAKQYVLQASRKREITSTWDPAAVDQLALRSGQIACKMLPMLPGRVSLCLSVCLMDTTMPITNPQRQGIF